MENVLVDIRNESDVIKQNFPNKDLVSVEDLLMKIDELTYYLNEERK